MTFEIFLKNSQAYEMNAIANTTASLLPFNFGYSTQLIQQLYTQKDKEMTLIDKIPM